MSSQKLLIANRGEIALRILHTARRLNIPTVALYTSSDGNSPHVLLANDSISLDPASLTHLAARTNIPLDPDSLTFSEGKAYLSIPSIVFAIRAYNAIHPHSPVTLIHPGYGFLSENADFALSIRAIGITLLGPQPEVISQMGLKHVAKSFARDANVPIVPGLMEPLRQEGTQTGGNAEAIAELVHREVGFPVMVKASAGGGGMGMAICHGHGQLVDEIGRLKQRSLSLFGDSTLLVERYIPRARHIEIQVFGNGLGHAVHMRERECSVQRRHQKIIEETPSPFLDSHPDVRKQICSAAIRLAQSINYSSAGTIEFIVDDETEEFFFLEMNTRIQVEHPVTEETHPDLDIVELMIIQGIAERESDLGGLDPDSPWMQQSTYDEMRKRSMEMSRAHAIEGRIYAENPANGFSPCPGLLQYVNLFESDDPRPEWIRTDSWISTGTTITSHFDPLLSKLIVTGSNREQAIERFIQALSSCKILGPPNNIEYLVSIVQSTTFKEGKALTAFLDTFEFTPHAIQVLSPGIDATIQDLQGRTTGMGVPRSGPMDPLAFRIANILVSNPETTEQIEVVLLPGMPAFSLKFSTNSGEENRMDEMEAAVVAITGKHVFVTLDGKKVDMWSRLVVPNGGVLRLEAKNGEEAGLRVYISVRGGFPGVARYLGSKSTSMGLGGYQGRALAMGDQLTLGSCYPSQHELEFGTYLPKRITPRYTNAWVIDVLRGPHDTAEFLTQDGISRFYDTTWSVSPSSNRLGIHNTKLEPQGAIWWSRTSGGEGGSHPSNILDNGYAPGAINVNGDTPVILTNEGPDMGGYVCLCAVANGDMWKLGQLAPGDAVKFRPVVWKDALLWRDTVEKWIESVAKYVQGGAAEALDWQFSDEKQFDYLTGSPILDTLMEPSGDQILFRQAGDSAILVEFGPMELNLLIRARIQAFETVLHELANKMEVKGLTRVCPCTRSILCYYDSKYLSQHDVLSLLLRAVSLSSTLTRDGKVTQLKGRRITFPIVLDDRWCKEALERYMKTVRDQAVYLPSNIKYLARNNGFEESVEKALDKLVAGDWLVVGVGFYMACPFLVPIDPRCRLVGQKMNPSRTWTPRGAVGLAGPVAAIYPLDSPGGYQLFGRTLPPWQTWGRGKSFEPNRPWLLRPFDSIRFRRVGEEEYIKLEKEFDAGNYVFEIEETMFDLKEHAKLLENVREEVRDFKGRQNVAGLSESAREEQLLREWKASKQAESREITIEGGMNTQNAKTITSPIHGSIFKVCCSVGHTIASVDEVLIVMEAMKTEVEIKAGEGMAGGTVVGFGEGLAGSREGKGVKAGEVLIWIQIN
ncbi:hypothetical protein AMATHDRAFT_149874 [Amanita thiersii Skay4041]|uniref:Urea carboxylase n=1 Tax=Amanita thiersii Skay4041 TaxID=703135 RepID=A0A2A9NBN9_9AGAR|nr:hypothetical protein AMATHDRAFT_149874 [Amanita thiersii Skay4041]